MDLPNRYKTIKIPSPIADSAAAKITKISAKICPLGSFIERLTKIKETTTPKYISSIQSIVIKKFFQFNNIQEIPNKKISTEKSNQTHHALISLNDVVCVKVNKSVVLNKVSNIVLI